MRVCFILFDFLMYVCSSIDLFLLIDLCLRSRVTRRYQSNVLLCLDMDKVLTCATSWTTGTMRSPTHPNWSWWPVEACRRDRGKPHRGYAHANITPKTGS